MDKLFWTLLLVVEPSASGIAAAPVSDPLNKLTNWHLPSWQWFLIIYGVLALATILIRFGLFGEGIDSAGDFFS